MENIEKEIIAIISEVTGFDESDIKPETNFLKELEIDSIKAIEITVAIEKKFKISIRDEYVPRITNVREAVELVKSLIGKEVNSLIPPATSGDYILNEQRRKS